MNTQTFLLSLLRNVLVFSVAMAVIPVAAEVQPTCIPPAEGVFGNPTPPHWWEGNSPPQAVYAENLDDPRWVGAGVITYGDGTVNQADFRALHGDSGANIYLSWRVFMTPASSANQNQIYIGLQRSPASGGGNMVITITLPGTVLAPNHAINPAIKANVLENDGTLGAVIPTPAWLSSAARVWVNDPVANLFAGQIRIPISEIVVTGGASPSDPTGGTLKMWWELLGGSPATHVFLFTWPMGPDGEFTPGSGFDPSKFPLSDKWNSFLISSGPSDPNCANSGVSLDIYQIGTHNSPSSRVLYKTGPTPPPPPPPVNTFFARPMNGTKTAIAAGTLLGRFRVANWGSMPGQESGVLPSLLWSTIPGGDMVGNSGPIPAGSLADAMSELRFDWTLSPADFAPYEDGTRSRDNCLLVELTSTTGLTFTNNSIRRNMNFEHASKMERTAEISVKGLTPIASDGRDVYLYIEALNLPRRVVTPPGDNSTPVPREGNFQDRERPNLPGPEQLHESAASGALTDAQMDLFIPTYRIHVLHDTGKTITTGAVKRPILRPQSGFGYRVIHQGEVIGWVHKTICEDCKLEQITPNFYRIKKVPNNGVVHVRTTIEAIEPGRRYRLFLDLGPNFPQGDFGDDNDGRLSINAGLEGFIASNTSLEGILGQHEFDGNAGSNPRIYQVSLNLKQYFGQGPLHYFVNGGVGSYHFSIGSTNHVGANVGLGVLYDLSSIWGLEGVYNFHAIDTSGSQTRFSTVQIGVRRSL